MADFCRQCNRELFGQDDSDYGTGRPLGQYYHEICEGCGFIFVDADGYCRATKAEGCVKGHGDPTRQGTS